MGSEPFNRFAPIFSPTPLTPRPHALPRHRQQLKELFDEMKQAPPPQKGPEDWQPTDRTMSLSALSRVDSARSDTADSTACTEYAVSCPDFHDLGVNVYKVGDNIESVSWEWVKSAQSAPPKEKKEIPCGGEQDVAGW